MESLWCLVSWINLTLVRWSIIGKHICIRQVVCEFDIFGTELLYATM